MAFSLILSPIANFNSRPHGGRLNPLEKTPTIRKFQLTPSRRATEDNDISILSESFQLTPSRRATDNRLDEKSYCSHFNSRPHGGRQTPYENISIIPAFQLTPSRRATEKRSICNTNGLFQLTPSRRATVFIGPPPFYVRKFQLTPSRRATTLEQALKYGIHQFQLTPSRRATGADGKISNQPISFQLTPSRRATRNRCSSCFGTSISTHALTEGDWIFHFCKLFFCISTHALTEGDLADYVPPWQRKGISTHALTEGDCPPV